VVSDTDARYSILLNDGTVYDVSVLARDPQLDIAILQITEPPADPLPFLRFGASDTIQLGQTVIAIGNALAEFRNSVSVGVVSGVSRSIVASDGFGRSELLDQVIQTDAAINPGNSGGPLLNLDGDVVGVNVATSRGADNIGFALPAEVVENVVSSVREYGEIVRPFLGVRYTMISESMATMNDLPVTYGALVTAGQNSAEPAVQPESPAALAGITEGTIILEIDGEALRDRDLATALRSKAVGEDVTLLLLQEGEEKTVSVTLQKAVQ
jgi:serine protease Do